MYPHPASPPDRLIERAEQIIAPVAQKIQLDQRLVPVPWVGKALTRNWAQEAISLAMTNPYQAERVSSIDAESEAPDDIPTEALRKTELAHINLSDLWTLSPPASRPCSLKVILLQSTYLPVDTGLLLNAFLKCLSKEGSMFLRSIDNQVWIVDDRPDTTPNKYPEQDSLIAAIVDRFDYHAPYLARKVLTKPNIRVTKRAVDQLVQRTLVELNPWEFLSPDKKTSLADCRSQFWAAWGNNSDLDAFWEKSSWSGRHQNLNEWLDHILFLGQSKRYLFGSVINRDFGRSLVVRRMGFRDGARAECAVCGVADAALDEDHSCEQLVATISRRPAMRKSFYLANPIAARLRSYACCPESDRVWSYKTLEFTAAASQASVPPFLPNGATITPVIIQNDKVAGIWVSPLARYQISLKFESKSGFELEVWGKISETAHLLATIQMGVMGGQLTHTITNNFGPGVQFQGNKLHVHLLHDATLIVVTHILDTVRVETAVRECGHCRQHSRALDGSWTPEPCPLCQAPPSSRPTQLWVRIPSPQPSNDDPDSTLDGSSVNLEVRVLADGENVEVTEYDKYNHIIRKRTMSCSEFTNLETQSLHS